MTQVNGFIYPQSCIAKRNGEYVSIPIYTNIESPDMTNKIAIIQQDLFEYSMKKKARNKLSFADKICEIAIKTANKMQSVGYCFRGVKNSLKKLDVSLWGGSAYMAADQLAKNDKFEEIEVEKKDLKTLSKGCVVVWNKSTKHPHGHISIALGNGKEASDHIQNQIQNYGTSFRVFKPV